MILWETTPGTSNWEATEPATELTGDEANRLSAYRQSANYPTPQYQAYQLADTEPEDRQALLDHYRELSILNSDPICVVHRLTRPRTLFLLHSTQVRDVDEGDGIVRPRGVCDQHAEAAPPGPIVLRQ